MNWILIFILALLCHVTHANTGNSSLVAASQKNLDASGGLVNGTTSTQESAGIDDVSCTTTDDVTAARKSLCPAQCSCSPLDGQEAWTKLTVDCSAGTSQSNFTQYLDELLSTCTSELLELSIHYSPLAEIPEALCRLSKIQALNLDSNRLAALPSNCFTRMRNLTTFSANNNSLTSLQVCYRNVFSGLLTIVCRYGVYL